MTDRSKLFYGDNLAILAGGEIATASVDLVYLDPPFNSDRIYNVTFASAGDALAQIQAFTDTWKWSNETDEIYEHLVHGGGLPPTVAEALEAFRGFLSESNLMAYLINMTPRLVELRRVLKPTGSLYLHCDPTASHYLKVMLDTIFGPRCFRNEIIWRRTGAHGPRNSFGPIHDTLLFYSREPTGYYFKVLRRPYTEKHVRTRYTVQPDGRLKFTSGGNVLTGANAGGGESSAEWKGFKPADKNRHWAMPGFVTEQMPPEFAELSPLAKLDAAFAAGLIEIVPGAAWPTPVRYLNDGDGSPVPDIWCYEPGTEGTLHGTAECIDWDVKYLGPTDPERLKYPTQKPLGLLERVLNASCPPDGVVLDPFCGCGTTLDAAVKLGRKWIGIDITYIAVDLIRNRLRETYGDAVDATYDVLGIPADLASAHDLYDKSHFEFERWAVSLVRGTPKEKPGGDKGKDGIIKFATGKKTSATAIVSVKGGKNLNPAMVRDLEGTVGKDKKAEMGVLVCLHTPTKGMYEAAATSGNYVDWIGNVYPKVQILTIDELLNGKRAQMPPVITPYVKAKKAKPASQQMMFEMEYADSDDEPDDSEVDDDE